MSQSPSPTGYSEAVSTDRRFTDESAHELLSALDDDDCRAMLDATDDRALTASELADRTEVPLSTVYRKLDRLTAVGLLEERTRFRKSGNHSTEYVRAADDVDVSLAGGGVEITVSRRDDADDGLAAAD